MYTMKAFNDFLPRTYTINLLTIGLEIKYVLVYVAQDKCVNLRFGRSGRRGLGEISTENVIK